MKGIQMRVPFEIVDEEVEKMYDQLYGTADAAEVDKLATQIVKFILRCGWTEESYFACLMRTDQLN
jgi:hypothetical protein